MSIVGDDMNVTSAARLAPMSDFQDHGGTLNIQLWAHLISE